MAIAVFDYATWSALYPELVAAGVTEPRATALFAQAGLYLDNTDASIVTDVLARLALLNILVAHLASLGGANNAAAASGLVGRVTSATEGTVNVKVETGNLSAMAAWYAQTPYGFSYWQATAPYRTFRYVPGEQPGFEPLYNNGRRGWLR